MTQVKRLLEIAFSKGAIKYGQFILSSGKQSNYYFDGRLLSLDPEGAHLIGMILYPILDQAGVQAVGGLTLGADPIVTAVSITSHLMGKPMTGFIVRKDTKGHGTQQQIEGPLEKGTNVAIVDDVCTTGSSLFNAIEAAETFGCPVVKVIAILDRMQGGGEELRKRGYNYSPLLWASPDGDITLGAV